MRLIPIFLLIASNIFSQIDSIVTLDGKANYVTISSVSAQRIDFIQAGKKRSVEASSISGYGFGSLDRDESGNIIFSKVVASPGMNREQIYSHVKSWFIDAFKDSEAVIEFDDKELGKIVGRGSYLFKTMNIYRIPFQVEVLIKDSRSKITISDLMIEYGSSKYNLRATLDEYFTAKGGLKYPRPDRVKDFVISGMMAVVASYEQAIESVDKDEFDF